ncbi:hypothetical protein TNCV_4062791 [Trichonephila clavipes]|nr:hypothetical protein TNCV_4062791 [Trichonephila clavipes]
MLPQLSVLLNSHYKTRLGLLVVDLVILNHGQVTRSTPELTLPSEFGHHTNGRALSSTDLTCISLSTWSVFSSASLKYMTDQPRVYDYNH